ncbi:MAG: hypothetical protein ONA90_05920, partial [candidate division KSB1 bacterium]|nr:hypothetical protein [candidate division KSB1 bacterium]
MSIFEENQPPFFAIHFSVLASELFYPQLACISEKLAALGWKLATLVNTQASLTAEHATGTNDDENDEFSNTKKFHFDGGAFDGAV